MGFEVREALRRLCDEIGWSYAVFWRAVGFPSAKHLVWDDGHWLGKLQFSGSNDVNSHISYLAELQSLGEGSIDELVVKTMVTQVHVIGVGIVGQAASTGNHRWILRNVSGDNESTLKNFHDVNNQFMAGIQTIVIIPVFPHGVVQFGSTKRVLENLLFVNHVRTSFTQPALEPKSSIYGLTKNTRPSINPAISDYLFRDNSNSVDKSLSIRCNHQLSISSGVSSSPLAELNPPWIRQDGNLLSHLNKPLENEPVEAQVTSNEGNLCLMERNLLPSSGIRTEEPALMEAISRNSYGSNLSQNAQGVSSSSCGSPLFGLQGHLFGSSSVFGASQVTKSADFEGDDGLKVEKLQKICAENDSSFFLTPNEKSPFFSQLSTSGDDLFDVLGLYDSGKACGRQFTADFPASSTRMNLSPISDPTENSISCTEVFSESNADQLLDAVVSSVCHGARQNLNDSLSWKTSATKVSSSSIPCSSPSNDGSAYSLQRQRDYISSSVIKSNADAEEAAMNSDNLCVESGKNTNNDDLIVSHGKRVGEISKLSRKRARHGETARPRPKDRQLIMDRVKELREIVPNGAKCSIDALLEKTIKHMLFLQSVSKHADKLKKTGEPKIVSKDGVVVLKDNFRGGATWAFEVGSQTMTCPIIVEDLNPPREMLVEMLCEERGLFLEIADLIRGLGLSILKGVMEACRDKIWARFAVEANRDVTRMEIFLSLVRLLEPTIGGVITPYSIHNSKSPQKIFNLPCVPATGASNPLQ